MTFCKTIFADGIAQLLRIVIETLSGLIFELTMLLSRDKGAVMMNHASEPFQKWQSAQWGLGRNRSSKSIIASGVPDSKGEITKDITESKSEAEQVEMLREQYASGEISVSSKSVAMDKAPTAAEEAAAKLAHAEKVKAAKAAGQKTPPASPTREEKYEHKAKESLLLSPTSSPESGEVYRSHLAGMRHGEPVKVVETIKTASSGGKVSSKASVIYEEPSPYAPVKGGEPAAEQIKADKLKELKTLEAKLLGSNEFKELMTKIGAPQSHYALYAAAYTYSANHLHKVFGFSKAEASKARRIMLKYRKSSK